MKLTPFAAQTLRDRYMTDLDQEPSDVFTRAIKSYMLEPEHEARMLKYVDKQWFTPSTPILSNAGTDRGSPISCFLNHVEDSRTSINAHYSETGWLASNGGGVGTSWSKLRSVGSKTSKGSQSNGVIPFISVLDRTVLAFSQGGTRRASYAAYLDVGHPEIAEFIEMRKPTGGGDINRKSLNLHHGVCLSDAFMNAVMADIDWDLIDPHTKEVKKTVKARDLWEAILETRALTGEPYMFFTDNVNNKRPKVLKDLGVEIYGSNLCVAPETKILTDKGHVRISLLKDEEVNVWNGREWSQVTVRKTGEEQKLLKVVLSDGKAIDCTPYHKFYVKNSYHQEAVIKRAHELNKGDKLIKLETVAIEGTKVLDKAYTNGFFTADGTGSHTVYLYGKKKMLKPFIEHEGKWSEITIENGTRLQAKVEGLRPKHFVPDAIHTIESRLQWFAGLIDGDGVICVNGDSQTLQLGSINLTFLREVQLMLQTLGVQSKIRKMRDAGQNYLPKNDGTGNYAFYDTQATYRLLITGTGLWNLLQLGLKTNRLHITAHKPNRECSALVKVEDVIDEGRYDDTYCFTEPLRNMGVFNGILTGNCTETLVATQLPNGTPATGTCCLGSLNIELFDEYKDDLEQVVEDCLLYLSIVQQTWVDSESEGSESAQANAAYYNDVGLGACGFHGYLQKKGIPFESALATSANHKIFGGIWEAALKANKVLADVYGSCDAHHANGTEGHFTHLLAVAPNASTSIFIDTTPGIEPNPANVFLRKTASGTSIEKNKHLQPVLAKYGKDDDETWNDIALNAGSVQHLEFLSEWERDVFKTAREINQQWVIQHAADRTQYIDQGASTNLMFDEGVSREYFNKIHLLAWQQGLKTLYYCRMDVPRDKKNPKQHTIMDTDCLACAN